ncbi:hypothetical protein [Paracoccus aestuariivivens]|uniref:Uncharacterized protein n=1 Tax=Paracoccus aestuariivivens TaxID=1820333 RepID=A0A6L6JFS4_9RHOB|nr:hypothetical protein [Paracoccus aestuariivivens]MTH78741.1 hypothetical protein [Paracoccus aestuariivivens]
MQPAEFKRGATFKADLKFDDATEWAFVYPHDSVSAAVKFGHRRYPLVVTVDPVNFKITATAADTSAWPLTGTEHASFDYWITKDGELLPFPGSNNIPLKIIEGATR